MLGREKIGPEKTRPDSPYQWKKPDEDTAFPVGHVCDPSVGLRCGTTSPEKAASEATSIGCDDANEACSLQGCPWRPPGQLHRSATCVGQMAVGSPDAWNDLGTSHTSVIKMLSRCGGTLARLPVPGGASVDNTSVRYSDADARSGLTVRVFLILPLRSRPPDACWAEWPGGGCRHCDCESQAGLTRLRDID